MRTTVFLFTAGAAAALLVAGACGDDHATVRDRLDGSDVVDAGGDGATGNCGATFPSTYESPSFDDTAQAEIALRGNFSDFIAPMANVESQLAADAGAPTPVTRASLVAKWTASPSVKDATTAYYQPKVDAAITAYEAALTSGVYTPEPSDGASGHGGTYGGFVFDPTGLDLRQIIERGSYAAVFYARAAGIVKAGSLTVGSVDRLVALFGATPAFPNDAKVDLYSAALAAQRDTKDPAHPGPYQRIKSALIKARTLVAAGDSCAAERDATLKIFLSEWEKSQYATVIFALNDASTRLEAPSVTNYGPALHSFGEAVALIQSFKGIDQGYRIITDLQIDGLLNGIGAPDNAPSSAYLVATSPTATVAKLTAAIGTIKDIYGFTSDDVTAFEKDN
jgi:hypothetical protein